MPVLPRISNFDDLDPLKLEPGVDLVMVRPGEPLPVCDLVVLPGSKATIADLAALRGQGWDIDILAHARRGGRVLGLCGGYQMLGRRVADPDGVEGPPGAVAGLGLLDVETVLTGAKVLRPVPGTTAADGAPFAATRCTSARRPAPTAPARCCASTTARRTAPRRPTGASAAPTCTASSPTTASAPPGSAGSGPTAPISLRGRGRARAGRLADHLERHLDLDRLLALAR